MVYCSKTPLLAAREQCDMSLTQSVGLKAISYLLVSFTKCLDQIAVFYVNIWLSYGGNMNPCMH